MQITQELLLERFDYDEKSGNLVYRYDISGRAMAGQIAGTLNKGYLRIAIKSRTYAAHRLIWLYMTGSNPEGDIDHIDGDRSNNRWSNLRKASRSENLCNTSIRKNKSSSGVKGVHFCKTSKAWIARLRVGGKFVYREKFETLEEASAEIQIHRTMIHGEFAKHD